MYFGDEMQYLFKTVTSFLSILYPEAGMLDLDVGKD